MKKYFAKTKIGGFEIEAVNVAEAWAKAKQEAEEVNKARKEIGLIYFNYHLCKVIKILLAPKQH